MMFRQKQHPFFTRLVSAISMMIALFVVKPVHGQAVNLEWVYWPMWSFPQVHTSFYHPNSAFHYAVHYAVTDWDFACYNNTLYSAWAPRLVSGSGSSTLGVAVQYDQLPTGTAAEAVGYGGPLVISGAGIFINENLMPPWTYSVGFRIGGSPMWGVDFESTMRHELGHVHTIGHGGSLMAMSIFVGTSAYVTDSDCAMVRSKYP